MNSLSKWKDVESVSDSSKKSGNIFNTHKKCQKACFIYDLPNFMFLQVKGDNDLIRNLTRSIFNEDTSFYPYNIVG